MKKVWIFCGVNLALALADGALTYIGTPDLALEGNPLVRVWGFGWPALLIANALALALYFAGTWYTYAKYQSAVFPGATFREYISLLYFNDKNKFWKIFYGIPKNWKPVGAWFGYAFSFCAPFSRAYLVLDWIFALTKSPLYAVTSKLDRMVPLHRFDVWATLLLMLILTVRWHWKEYKSQFDVTAEAR